MELTVDDIADLGTGATVLGSGGGGSTASAEVIARQAIRARGAVRVITPAEAVAEFGPAATAVTVGAVGSSTLLQERLPGGREFPVALEALQRHAGVRASVLLALEIGGVNALLAAYAAAELGLPLLDADAMGRAFPGVHQTTMTAAGVTAAPAVLAGPSGATVLIDGVDNQGAERIVRSALPALGGWAAAAMYLCPVGGVGDSAVGGSLRRALGIGTALRAAQRDPAARTEFLRACGAELVFEGVAEEVLRFSERDLAGVLTLSHGDHVLRVDMGNEFLLAVADGVPVAVVPDLIVVLQATTWQVIAVDRVRPGIPLSVLRLPVGAPWDRRQVRWLVGPQAHGLHDVPGGDRPWARARR